MVTFSLTSKTIAVISHGYKMQIYFDFLLNKIPSADFMFLTHCGLVMQHRSGSTLAQVMACCLMAPSHYPNKCWLIISGLCGIYMREIFQEIPMLSMCKVNYYMFVLLPLARGANELISFLYFKLLPVCAGTNSTVWCHKWLGIRPERSFQQHADHSAANPGYGSSRELVGGERGGGVRPG